MSENENKKSPAQPVASLPVVMQQPETQHERWVKYGLNVLVMTLAAIVLVILLTYLAQSFDKRIDTTTGGSQSLSPQTLNIIKGLKQKVTIVALYPKLRTESGEQDYYQPVADLLNNYASKGANVTAEMLDPNVDKTGFDKLVSDVTNRYGGEVKNYKAIVNDEFPGASDTLKKYATAELAKYQDLPLDQIQDQATQQNLWLDGIAVASIPKLLDRLKESVDDDTDQKIPNYKDAVDNIKSTFDKISGALGGFSEDMTKPPDADKLPKEFKAYMPDAAKRATAAKVAADAILTSIGKLPPVKQMDEFRQQLAIKSIIVEAEDGYKIIAPSQIWTPQQHNPMAETVDNAHKYRFAGEQQISMAIASLASPAKQTIVFVHAPMQGPITTGQGMFVAFANRLREYNFDVLEKEVGGPPEQEQQEQMPQPTPEQMKNSIWVVMRFPGDNQMAAQMGMPGPSPINGMLQDHLKTGGSALVMVMPSADAMSDVFGPLGVSLKTDYMLTKQTLPPAERHTNDQGVLLNRMYQFVFLTNQYGDHPLTKPLADLDMLMLLTSPIVPDSTPPAGVTVTPLLPVPNTPHSWGSKEEFSKISQRDYSETSFSPADDLDNNEAHPLYGAAAIEKKDGGRVVVLGGWQFLQEFLLTLPDDKDPDVPRLPGNFEFPMDSMFWLGHMDSMLAISPHALQMARIAPMSSAKQNVIRVGLLTAGLPLAVALAGLLVYVRRRD